MNYYTDYYTDWYAPWEGSLPPARRRILNFLMLCIIPLVVIFSIWWTFFFIDALTRPRQVIPATEQVVRPSVQDEWCRTSGETIGQPRSP